jgi:hypothetical protein
MRLCRKAAGDSDVDYAPLGSGEQDLGADDAAVDKLLVRRFARSMLEHPAEMIGRKFGHRRHVGQTDRTRQILVDEIEHPLQPDRRHRQPLSARGRFLGAAGRQIPRQGPTQGFDVARLVVPRNADFMLDHLEDAAHPFVIGHDERRERRARALGHHVGQPSRRKQQQRCDVGFNLEVQLPAATGRNARQAIAAIGFDDERHAVQFEVEGVIGAAGQHDPVITKPANRSVGPLAIAGAEITSEDDARSGVIDDATLRRFGNVEPVDLICLAMRWLRLLGQRRQFPVSPRCEIPAGCLHTFRETDNDRPEKIARLL